MFHRKIVNRKINSLIRKERERACQNFLRRKISGGFTLIEMLVSVGVFTVVVVISLGALLIVNDAFRKTRLLKNAVENAAITIEGMSKKIRVGTSYHCGGPPNILDPADCAYSGANGGDSYFAFQTENSIIEYKYNASSRVIETRTCTPATTACDSNSDPWSVITSPDLEITALVFYVNNAESTALNPYITIVVGGTAAIPSHQELDTTFNIQTTISQRAVAL